MKTKSNTNILFTKILTASLLLGTNLALAAPGVGAGGGGDRCQDRIEEIRNDLSEWIQADGSEKLNFSESDTTLTDYNRLP
jgi:hypothetical protein